VNTVMNIRVGKFWGKLLQATQQRLGSMHLIYLNNNFAVRRSVGYGSLADSGHGVQFLEAKFISEQ
jgi:hypothetical protein